MERRKLALLLLLPLMAGELPAQHRPTTCPGQSACILTGAPASPDPYILEAVGRLADSFGLVPVQVRMSNVAGPLGHKWVQIGTGENAVTIGFGAANIPLADAGQVVITDRSGVETVSRWHLFPFHLPPAELPDKGHSASPTVYVTVAQAYQILRQERRHRFLFPYIPLFHDCHTFTCEVMAAAEGKSSLPCYLRLKGHF